MHTVNIYDLGVPFKCERFKFKLLGPFCPSAQSKYAVICFCVAAKSEVNIRASRRRIVNCSESDASVPEEEQRPLFAYGFMIMNPCKCCIM